jgi:putative acetyltransferase
VKIRLASQKDSDSVCEVVKAVYDEYGFTWDPDTYHADLYDLDGFYFDRGDLFWVAELDDKIVGTVALEFFDRIPGTLGTLTERPESLPRVAGTDCSLERLYVHPEARRAGVGTQLVMLVLDEARRRERTNIEMWSDKRFGDAHRLYGRFGAEVVADRICDDPDVSPEWGLLVRLGQGTGGQ